MKSKCEMISILLIEIMGDSNNSLSVILFIIGKCEQVTSIFSNFKLQINLIL